MYIIAMADRFNVGKTRFDLLHPRANRDLAEAFTFGASKYGDYNWHKGMEWSKMIASAKRHLNAIEMCEDYDPESGLLHVAHLAANIHMLNAYYYIYPMGDNRIQHPLHNKNIAIDIEVIADSSSLADISCYDNLIPSIKCEDLPFKPICYISDGRNQSIIQEWMKRHGFTPFDNVLKSDQIEAYNIDIVIHTNYDTYLNLRSQGVCVYLWDMPYNRFADVGHFRLDIPKMKRLFQ